jgi:hypothetical protein
MRLATASLTNSVEKQEPARYSSVVVDPERFAVEFKSSDDANKDVVLIRLEGKPRTLEETRAACETFGVRARLMRGDLVHGWVEADGAFSPGGPLR